jgi:hypothetical protein
MALLETLLLVKAGSELISGSGSIRAAAAASREGRRLYRDAIERGEEAVDLYEMDLSRLLGAQRTILAAGQGLDVNQGSAAQLREQTERFGEEDVDTIRENAMREALGLRRQARNQAQGLRAQAVGQFAGAAGTLLTAGANQWDIYSRRRGVRRAVGNTIGRDIAVWG